MNGSEYLQTFQSLLPWRSVIPLEVQVSEGGFLDMIRIPSYVAKIRFGNFAMHLVRPYQTPQKFTRQKPE